MLYIKVVFNYFAFLFNSIIFRVKNWVRVIVIRKGFKKILHIRVDNLKYFVNFSFLFSAQNIILRSLYKYSPKNIAILMEFLLNIVRPNETFKLHFVSLYISHDLMKSFTVKIFTCTDYEYSLSYSASKHIFLIKISDYVTFKSYIQ